MDEVKLSPEVIVPRPRSSGVAWVMLAALAILTAIGASAFAVRVRMIRDGCPWAATIEPETSQQVFLAAPSSASFDNLPAEQATLVRRFQHEVQLGDNEAALEAYVSLPAGSPGRVALAPAHELVARHYLEVQLGRLGSEIGRGDCGAVKERVARLARLLPETRIDTARCR